MSSHVVRGIESPAASVNNRFKTAFDRIEKLELAMQAAQQSKQPYICKGNVTSDKFQVYNAEPSLAQGLHIQVDTSACHFNQTPTYFANVQEKWGHWGLLGTSAIYAPTPTHFVIYLGSVWTRFQMNAQDLLAQAQNENYQWQIDWIGID